MRGGHRGGGLGGRPVARRPMVVTRPSPRLVARPLVGAGILARETALLAAGATAITAATMANQPQPVVSQDSASKEPANQVINVNVTVPENTSLTWTPTAPPQSVQPQYLSSTWTPTAPHQSIQPQYLHPYYGNQPAYMGQPPYYPPVQYAGPYPGQGPYMGSPPPYLAPQVQGPPAGIPSAPVAAAGIPSVPIGPSMPCCDPPEPLYADEAPSVDIGPQTQAVVPDIK